MVVFGKSGCSWEKGVVFGKSCCIQAKVVVLGQRWLYSRIVVVIGQSGCIPSNSGSIRPKVVVFRQSGRTRA